MPLSCPYLREDRHAPVGTRGYAQRSCQVLGVSPEASDSLPGQRGRLAERSGWDPSLGPDTRAHSPEGPPGGEASPSQGEADRQALREVLDADAEGQVPERPRRPVKGRPEPHAPQAGPRPGPRASSAASDRGASWGSRGMRKDRARGWRRAQEREGCHGYATPPCCPSARMAPVPPC